MKKRVMKRLAALLLITYTMVSVLTGCTQKNDSTNVNKKYSETGMVNLMDQPYNYEKGDLDKRIGLGYAFTDVESKLEEEKQLQVGYIPNQGYVFSYRTEKGLNIIKELDKGGPEAIIPDMSSEFFEYATIYRIPNDTKDEMGQSAMKYLTEVYSNKKVIATLGDYTYYFAWNDDFSKMKELGEKDKKNLDALIANSEKFINGSCVFPSSNEKSNMKDFNAKTLDGGTFTQEDLAKYDITMVNIWTTWCGGCIEEMPELQALYEKLPENMNMISICGNGDMEEELAREILNKNGCKFSTLIPDEKLQESLIKYIDAFPTTVFVDTEGNIIGDKLIGAPAQNKEDIADAYLDLMNERLEMSIK